MIGLLVFVLFVGFVVLDCVGFVSCWFIDACLCYLDEFTLINSSVSLCVCYVFYY